jgi:hypothetical protein
VQLITGSLTEHCATIPATDDRRIRLLAGGRPSITGSARGRGGARIGQALLSFSRREAS